MRLSIILGLSSNNWIGLLLCMEFNFVVFLPLLFNKIRTLSSEGVISYLLAQVLGSILVLSWMFLFSTSFLEINHNNILLIGGLILKLGIFPIHSWFINILNQTSALYFWLIATTQKILPLLLLSLIDLTYINTTIILMRLARIVFGLRTSKVKTLLGYSSLIQIRLLLYLIILAPTGGVLFFIYYTITSRAVAYLLIYKAKSEFLNRAPTGGQLNCLLAFSILIGLPPFSMFWAKLCLILIVPNRLNLLVILVVLAGNMFIYLRFMAQGSMYGSTILFGERNNTAPALRLVFLNIIPWSIL